NWFGNLLLRLLSSLPYQRRWRVLKSERDCCIDVLTSWPDAKTASTMAVFEASERRLAPQKRNSNPSSKEVLPTTFEPKRRFAFPSFSKDFCLGYDRNPLRLMLARCDLTSCMLNSAPVIFLVRMDFLAFPSEILRTTLAIGRSGSRTSSKTAALSESD